MVGHLGELYTSVFGEFAGRISSGFGKEPGVADYASHPWHVSLEGSGSRCRLAHALGSTYGFL